MRVEKTSETVGLGSLVTVLAVVVMAVADLSKVNVALPAISAGIGAGVVQQQVIVAGYALAFGAAMVPAGRYGDLHTRAGVLRAGMFLYLVSSLGAAVAPDVTVLMIARICQGLAAGLLASQVTGLVQDCVDPSKRPRAYGLFGALIGVATALAPVLGGGLLWLGGDSADAWRLLFWINIPIGLFGCVLACVKRWPGQPRAASSPRGFDVVGVVLWSLLLIAVLLPILISSSGLGGGWALLALPVVPLVWLLFRAFERRRVDRDCSPLIPLELLGNRFVRRGAVQGALYNGAMTGGLLAVMLYLQEAGAVPLVAGIITVPFAAASALTASRVGRKEGLDTRPVAARGFTVMAVGFALVVPAAVVFDGTAELVLVGIALGVAGLGGGVVMPEVFTRAMAGVATQHPEDTGVAGSVVQVAQRVGTSVGIAGAVALMIMVEAMSEGAQVWQPLDWALTITIGVVVLLLVGALAVSVAENGNYAPRTPPRGSTPVPSEEGGRLPTGGLG